MRAALAPAPGRFTVADFAARVRAMTGQETYTVRQAACDLRKLRGKDLAVKPGKSRRYRIPPGAARAITALLTLRDHVLAPILAGVRSPPAGPQAQHLDCHRPRLREPPHRHADPVPARRHRNAPCHRIDNNLSIGEMQAPRDR